jgi:hypothetical protein
MSKRLAWAEEALCVPEAMAEEDNVTAAADLAVNLAHLIELLTDENGADVIRNALDLHYEAEKGEV